MQASGSSKWSSAPLQKAASNEPVRNGSDSDQARAQATRPRSGAGSFAATSFASSIMRCDGSAQKASTPVRASARLSWPRPAAESSTRAPTPARVAASVSASMRRNR